MRTTQHDHDRHRLRMVPKHFTSALSHLWASEAQVAAVELLAPGHGDHVIDLGSGFGPATGLLVERVRPGGTVTAIDPSRAMRSILWVRTRVARRGDVSIRNGTAERIPLPNASVDAVISLNAMHHMNDLAQAASELHRVLKPGRRLLLIDEDFDHPKHSMHHADRDNHHGLEPVDPDDVAALLTDAGFASAAGRRDSIGNEPSLIIEAIR